MRVVRWVLRTFELALTIFFVAMTTIELAKFLVDNKINPIVLQVAGIGLIGVLFLEVVVEAWEFFRELPQEARKS